MKNRVGETTYNNFGSLMVIEKYMNHDEIIVRFLEHGNFVNVRYDNFIRGKVKNPYDKTTLGVGFIGEGQYSTCENGKMTCIYKKWKNMMRRCYDAELHKSHPSYKDCSVVEEWHNFQNFAKWYDENYYEVEGEQMELDKDILIKGNKTYSPDTCIFVPRKINILFVKSNSIRGNLPIGVSWRKDKKKYESYYYKRGKRIKIGYFKSSTDAFKAYKVAKENLIREIAEEYKSKIPYRLYEAMRNYIVEITD